MSRRRKAKQKRKGTLRIVKDLLRGDETSFRKEVERLTDEEIERNISRLDNAMLRRNRIGESSLINREYAILVEERQRREDGTQDETTATG